MYSNDIFGGPTQTPMAKAWQEASIDLGFEFVTPYTFVDDAGIPHTCTGLVVHFGCAKGTLIVSQYDEDPDADVVGSELGYYTSALSPYHYEKYDRDVFVETLVDWGWYGPPEKRPVWMP